MTIFQHLHTYNFHTSNFKFWETCFLKFLWIQPLAARKPWEYIRNHIAWAFHIMYFWPIFINIRDPVKMLLWWVTNAELGWEIHSGFHGIPRLHRFRTFWTPEFSLEFYFSDRKMSSHQFWTRFFCFGILSRHLFFRFHESENVPAINVSGKWHQILILNAPNLFARTIAIPLLLISTWYTQKLVNLIDA